ncbi:hypothetical protein ScalyP_jg7351 [Parmales sp. scaly parma]|nr:hypothetical protein ScalyP_jg7351 [Parmales sp. scaly parma]
MVVGGSRVAAGTGPKKAITTKSGKAPRYYPADSVPAPVASRKKSKKAPKVRSTITPGTVLILLSGRFRGKRCVCLKSLASGLILVSGPFKVNGVPLKRVNQAYVIATSTKVDLKSVKVPGHIDDNYFAKSSEQNTVATSGKEEEFFQTNGTPAIVSDQRKKDQATVDNALLKVVAGQPMLKQYLNAKFSLTNSDRVHNMKF